MSKCSKTATVITLIVAVLLFSGCITQEQADATRTGARVAAAGLAVAGQPHLGALTIGATEGILGLLAVLGLITGTRAVRKARGAHKRLDADQA